MIQESASGNPPRECGVPKPDRRTSLHVTRNGVDMIAYIAMSRSVGLPEFAGGLALEHDEERLKQVENEVCKCQEPEQVSTPGASAALDS